MTFGSRMRGMNLIEELYALQDRRGWLRDDDLKALSRRLRVPLYAIEAVASYFPHFRRSEPPAVRVAACRDICCAMSGGAAQLERLRQRCAGRPDVELEAVSCLGRCDGAPACTVNGVPVPGASVAGYLDRPETLPPNEPMPRGRAWRCDAGERYGVLRRYAASGDIDGLIARLADSGLRGMGGAGFPTGTKWRLVRGAPATPKYVICNADESEPGTFKDSVLLEELPHRVIEGTVLGALATGAREGWVYIRHEYVRERRAMERAIDAAYREGVLGDRVCGSDHAFDLRVFVSPGGYILGEETALLEALEGKRGEPRNKPPFPGTHGLYGQPTLMNNVETLALVPHALRTGKADLKFFSVCGDVADPGVHEVVVGTTLEELIALAGGMRDGASLQAFLPGGASTGFLPREQAGIVMDWQPLQDAGSALGSGAVVIVGENADLLELAANLTRFFRDESCGKCVPCRIGTEKAVRIIEGRKPEELRRLPELHETLRQTSICGLGQAALIPVLSVLGLSTPGSGEAAETRR